MTEQRKHISLIRRSLGLLALLALACLLVVGCGGSGGTTTTSGTATTAAGSTTVASTESSNGLGPIILTPEQLEGRELFQSTCASCHTLKDAEASGELGPNLDLLRPPAAAVSETIETGVGQMPPHLLSKADAAAVADYVAAVTAH